MSAKNDIRSHQRQADVAQGIQQKFRTISTPLQNANFSRNAGNCQASAIRNKIPDSSFGHELTLVSRVHQLKYGAADECGLGRLEKPDVYR